MSKHTGLRFGKEALLCALFSLILASFFLLTLLLPDNAASRAERRTLRQAPAFTLQKAVSGEWATAFDAYLPDQFPLREGLRRLALAFRLNALRLSDDRGVYEAQGKLVYRDAPLNEKAASALTSRVNALTETYFSSARTVCFALIPDKSAYLLRDETSFSYDYDALMQRIEDGLTIRSIPLKDALCFTDYYDTDPHWRQEKLQGVVDALAEKLDFAAPTLSDMTPHTLSPFYGSYASRSPQARTDSLVYLTDAAQNGVSVENLQKPDVTSVYDLEAFSGMDGYDVFLSGATPLLALRQASPDADAEGRTLILVRDSFGSSLAPLLCGAYETIVLVDLRYLSERALAEYLPEITAETDVLYLFGAQTVNAGALSVIR